MIIRKGRQDRKKGWFEAFIDNTNIIEKAIFLIWFGMIYMFYLMFDMFDIFLLFSIDWSRFSTDFVP